MTVALRVGMALCFLGSAFIGNSALIGHAERLTDEPGAFVGFSPIQAPTGLNAGEIQALEVEAFKEAEPWIDVSMFEEKDPKRKAHKKLLKEAKRYTPYQKGTEVVTPLHGKSYKVALTDYWQTMYYRKDGTLSAIEFITGKDYPYKTYRYSYPFGRLLTVTITISPEEALSFRASGEMITF